jgi:outer membrane lipoprotein LolB
MRPAAAAPPRVALRRGLPATVAVLLSAACAPLPPAPPAGLAAREAVAAFELEGRISATDGSRAASGRFDWQHDPVADRWTVYNPLGQIAARLERDPVGARLLAADGSMVEATSAEELLPLVLGVEVPVARLARWVQAAPDDRAEVRHVDSVGRPTLVIDHGWRIDYPAYAGDGVDAPPARLDISRGDARIRLLIDQWTPLP